uniref:RRM domain-containing protein n=1 Tax=Heterorhabditis bacteriophora TaxID=37862 RepID=A0A1I7XI92_HETBA
MDFQNRAGGKTGGGGVDSAADANVDRRERLKKNKKKLTDEMDLEEKKRTIFVGNVPRTITIRACRKLFSQFGTIDTIRMRNIVPTAESLSKRVAHITGELHGKQNSVNFYVKYKQSTSVEKALLYNGTILEGHRIRVDTCYGKKDYNKSTTVFIDILHDVLLIYLSVFCYLYFNLGNIPFDTKEDDLANFFEEHVGSVLFVRCVKDQETGMGKGFAFVIFKSPSSVSLAVNMTGLQFMKRNLRITNIMKKSKVLFIVDY